MEAYDKDVLKMIADARLKLEKVNALVMSCSAKEKKQSSKRKWKKRVKMKTKYILTRKVIGKCVRICKNI